MARFDATKKAKKWASRVQGAGQDFADGVDAVQSAPGEAAAAKEATFKQRVNQSIDDGTWRNNVSSVTLGDWKAAAKQGQSAFTSGATKGQPKMQKYLQAAAPVYEQIRAEIQSMPNATDADREARMLRNMRLMKQLKGAGRR